MIYQIELAERDDFEIIHEDSDNDILKVADQLPEGYLNIFELNEDYEVIRQVYRYD